MEGRIIGNGEHDAAIVYAKQHMAVKNTKQDGRKINGDDDKDIHEQKYMRKILSKETKTWEDKSISH